MSAVDASSESAKYVQVTVDVAKALRAVQSDLPRNGAQDTSLLLKTVLAAAFDGVAIKPWRLHSVDHRIITVLGYASGDIEQALAFANPAVRCAVECFSVPLPPVQVGQRLRFRGRIVPTIKSGNKYKDAYLAALDANTDLSREEVYIDYFAKRLAGARLSSIQIEGFDLRKLIRPIHADKRDWASLTVPVVEFVGVLEVTDSSRFLDTLLTGIGRHRAYGFGYLRLEPASR